MQTANGRTGGEIGARVWRELGQLALEGLAIGIAFSVLLAAAVYMVARSNHGDDVATASTPAAEIAVHATN
jgi:hypothetical protein